MTAAAQRWATVDQLLQGLGPIPWTSADTSAPEPCDDWAEALVQAAAFAHVRGSPGCRGYTTWSSGRAGCGSCGWGMSARIAEVGATGSARRRCSRADGREHIAIVAGAARPAGHSTKCGVRGPGSADPLCIAVV